jgi:hypothetical protein
MGLSYTRGLTKWTKSDIRGTWTLEYLGFVNDVEMRKKRVDFPTKGDMGCVAGKIRSSRVTIKS